MTKSHDVQRDVCQTEDNSETVKSGAARLARLRVGWSQLRNRLGPLRLGRFFVACRGAREGALRAHHYQVHCDCRMSAVFSKNTAAAVRLRWRVVVRTEGKLDPSRPSRPLAWHLVTCRELELADSHCEEGRRLLATAGDPEGHCLLDGICPRCAPQN